MTPQCEAGPKVERRKRKEDADICDQPLPEVVPEEQDIHAHDNGDQGKHVKRDGPMSSHRLTLRVGGSPDVSRAVRCRVEGRTHARVFGNVTRRDPELVTTCY